MFSHLFFPMYIHISVNYINRMHLCNIMQYYCIIPKISYRPHFEKTDLIYSIINL